MLLPPRRWTPMSAIALTMYGASVSWLSDRSRSSMVSSPSARGLCGAIADLFGVLAEGRRRGVRERGEIGEPDRIARHFHRPVARRDLEEHSARGELRIRQHFFDRPYPAARNARGREPFDERVHVLVREQRPDGVVERCPVRQAGIVGRKARIALEMR